MPSNCEIVAKGLSYMREGLASYIVTELRAKFSLYGEDWWQGGVLNRIKEEKKRDFPQTGDVSKIINSLDVQGCLLLFDVYWADVFKTKLSLDHLYWAKELKKVRNKVAHVGGEDFDHRDTLRALDTMHRLCDQISPESREKIGGLWHDVVYEPSGGTEPVKKQKPKPASETGILDQNLQGLPSWRDIIEPHPDVAQGRYRNAEFAADLAQVARGEGTYEYRDPGEFFARTYITEGMKGLLVAALKRVCGKDGEPVIQLKTAFGGGKTHSLLALYHLLRGQLSISKAPGLEQVLERAGVASLPRVNVAVLVGTALNPSKIRRPQNFPGITISTLWGEMAAQLAQSAGKPELYNYVKEADRKGVSPGSETLRNLFDACGPCMVLMDEIVAYAKKLYGISNLPAGSYDNLITFVQEITEAARLSKNSLVVASIPESELEVGGDAGKQVLEAIEHTFGRMEAIWKPVAANEGFEVVRRRLFMNCKNTEARDKVCDAFSQMYLQNEQDFPPETKEVEYRKRMVACYPVHPEVFDRLYEDWATLERFQRTRGVLRLMAAVIHELWMGNDAGAMIMPGSLPMDVPSVRDELTRHLEETWNAIVDREVDGKKSIPYQKDKLIERYGRKLAARRVARTVMLGSAPTSRGQAVRGIEASRIRLGTVQPGEVISVFNDALNTLRGSLAYLYTDSSENRYWYDTRPTLRKTVEDRTSQQSEADVELEIERRLNSMHREYPFAGLHTCPGSSLDVKDDQEVRLVLLGLDAAYSPTADQEHNKAIMAASELLNSRGSSQRIYRNMLAFVAPDQEALSSLKKETRKYLAWLSIKNDREILNLDVAQIRETESGIARSNEAVDRGIKETYCWLLLPSIDREQDLRTINWETILIRGGTESIVSKAAAKMKQNEALITQWAPSLLLMELDDLLWDNENDCISVKELWEDLCKYCYLPRLAGYKVLEDAILSGVTAGEYFAVAKGKSGGRFLELRLGQPVGSVATSDYLVKLPAAQEQLEADRQRAQNANTTRPVVAPVTVENGGTSIDGGNTAGATVARPRPQAPRKTRFYMSAKLDNTRIGRDVQRYVEEVISHLMSAGGSSIEISLEVSARKADGFSSETIRTITENCNTLGARDSGFEEQ